MDSCKKMKELKKRAKLKKQIKPSTKSKSKKYDSGIKSSSLSEKLEQSRSSKRKLLPVCVKKESSSPFVDPEPPLPKISSLLPQKLLKIQKIERDGSTRYFVLLVKKGSEFISPSEHSAQLSKFHEPLGKRFKCKCENCQKGDNYISSLDNVEAHLRRQLGIFLMCSYCKLESYGLKTLLAHVSKKHWNFCFRQLKFSRK